MNFPEEEKTEATASLDAVKDISLDAAVLFYVKNKDTLKIYLLYSLRQHVANVSARTDRKLQAAASVLDWCA